MRIRQNYHRGYSTSRRIYIDQEVPFKELDNVEFSYNNNWYIKTLGDEEPYRFYLEKGKHTISMEVVPGNTCDLYQTLKDSVYELNRIYREILMVTGTTPDSYRDYYLENEMGDADTQKYKIWYNTYNKSGYDCPGLPAGAICSPSAASLKAAANPENTDYLYFGSDSSKNYFYTATFDEFKAKGAELGVNIR